MYNKLVTTYNDNFGDKKVDIDVKIEQVNKDIKALQTELNKLKEEKHKKETYIFQIGDVVINKYGKKRIIVQLHGNLVVFDADGYQQGTLGEYPQKHFEEFGYKKIGELKDLL